MFPVWLLAVVAVTIASLGVPTADAAPNNPASFGSLGTLNPGNNVTVNTGANPPTLAISGGATFNGTVSGTMAVFCFDSVDVAAGRTFTVSGTRSFVLLSKGTMNFNGTINANASGSTAGPGGYNGNSNAAGGFGFGAGGGDGSGSGGAGGGFGGAGGSTGFGGAAGGIQNGDLGATLEGGSGGGRSTYTGGGGASANGLGGGGGGAVELGAAGALTFGGTINCNGAAGTADFNFNNNDGGGGGAGGGILIHSTTSTLNIGGTLNARGANGGDGFWAGGGGGGGRIFCQGTAITANGTRDVSPGLAGGAGGSAESGLSGHVFDNVVGPVNGAPTVSAVGVTTLEDTAHTFAAAEFTASYTDPDGDPLQTVRVASLPANGTLTNNGVPVTAGNLPLDIPIANIGNLVYTPNANFDQTDTFNWNASDGLAFAASNALVTITVTPVNDAPVLDTSGNPTLNKAYNGVVSPTGTSVATLLARSANGDPITDVDTGALKGIAVIQASTANGSWEFSTNGGANWSAVPTPLSDTNALLLTDSADSRLRFNATGGFTGTINPAITFRAWDRTQGTNGNTFDITGNGGPGGESAFSTASETASMEVQLAPEIDIRHENVSIPDTSTDSVTGNLPPGGTFQRRYTIHNTGAGTLFLTGDPVVEIVGTTNATAYLAMIPDDQIAPNSTTQFALGIRPASAGAFTVTVRVENDDPDEADYTFTVSGTATTQPNIGVEYLNNPVPHQSQLPLGTLSAAALTRITLTIRNSGNALLGNLATTVTNMVNATGSVTNQSATTIASNGFDTVVIDFRPVASGAFSVQVNVASDDPDTNPYVIYLVGTGTLVAGPKIWIERLPGVEITSGASTDDIGNVLSTSNVPFTWRIRNTGSADLTVSTPTVSGNVNCNVNITTAPASLVTPGNFTTITITVSPLGAGAIGFDWGVDCNDFDNPSRSVAVTGTATATVAPEIQIYGPNGAPIANNGTATLPRYPTGNVAANYPFVIENRGTAALTVTLPIQLGFVSNAIPAIAQQPGTFPSVVVPAHGGSIIVVVQMTAINQQSPASFLLYVTSNDADEPFYTILGESPGPVTSSGSTLKKKKGCGIGDGTGADGTFFLLLVATLIALMATWRQCRPSVVA